MEGILVGIVALILGVVWLAVPVACGFIAAEKNRSWFGHALAGLVFGLVWLAVIIVIDEVRSDEG